MKNLILLNFFLIFGMNTEAQITLEQDYDSSSVFNSPSDQLMIVHFEEYGDCYVKINRLGKCICIYNMNHILLKNIDCSSFPLLYGDRIGEVLYISQHLFNLDSKIEFLYCYIDINTHIDYTGIYNEEGNLLFSDTGVPLIHVNTPQQQLPIYNTSQGTKMILSYRDGHAKVFSLPGTLSQSIAETNNYLISQSSLSNPYPNPVSNTTKVDYKLPEGVDVGELVFYDLQGKEIKRYRVDRTFDTLLISTSDIAAGTYFYQLQTAKDKSQGKKM